MEFGQPGFGLDTGGHSWCTIPAQKYSVVYGGGIAAAALLELRQKKSINLT
jgi:hypothetical protein